MISILRTRLTVFIVVALLSVPMADLIISDSSFSGRIPPAGDIKDSDSG